MRVVFLIAQISECAKEIESLLIVFCFGIMIVHPHP
jgi:hypothetical protein